MPENPILSTLNEKFDEISSLFDVKRMALFGSAVRNELNEKSDIDILVFFNNPATLKNYFGVKFYLEELLCRPVDLATAKMIKPSLMKRIEGSLLYVA